MPVLTMEQYANRALTENPELIEKYIDQDLNDAKSRLGQAEADIKVLTDMKSHLHPEALENPVEEAAETPDQESAETEPLA